MWEFIALLSVLIILMVICGFCYADSNMLPLITPLKKLPITNNYKKIKPSSVMIFMIVTPEILEYAKYSIDTNRNYCKKHGYAFQVIDTNLTPDLPINFSKLQATLDFFKQGFKYVVHLDADAIVVTHTYPITHIISKYFSNGVTSFIAGEDCYNINVCSKPGRMNSGVFIVKNSLTGRGIIQLWLDSARKGRCKQYTRKFPNCQLVFFHCVRYSHFGIFITLVPYNLLNGKDGLFIQHFMQHTNQERSDGFKKHSMEDEEFQKGNRRIQVF